MMKFSEPVINETGYSVVSMCRYDHCIWKSGEDGTKTAVLEVNGNGPDEESEKYEDVIGGIKMSFIGEIKLPCEEAVHFLTEHADTDIILYDGMEIEQMPDFFTAAGKDFLDRLYRPAYEDRTQFSVCRTARDCAGLNKVGAVTPPGEYLEALKAGRNPSRCSMDISVQHYIQKGEDSTAFSNACILRDILKGSKAADCPALIISDLFSEGLTDAEAESIIGRWQDILEHVRSHSGMLDVSFNAWLKNLAPNGCHDGKVCISYGEGTDRSALLYTAVTYGSFLTAAIEEICGLNISFGIREGKDED